jgi:hypothetical protein
MIYRWFIEDGILESEIATRLNSKGILTDLGRNWTRATIREILSNHKYVEDNVYNRISFKLKKHRIANQPEMWIKKVGAFQALVAPETFYMAQGILRARAHRFSNDELIEKLRHLYEHRGFLSGLIIDESEDMPSSAAYAYRFGSLIRAYEAVGFTPNRDYRFLEINKFLRNLHPEITNRTEQYITNLGGTVVRDSATDLLHINQEFTISIVLARCQTNESGRLRWQIRFDASLTPDITIAVRLDKLNKAPLDYYLLPLLNFGVPRIRLAEHNSIEYETFRFDNLDYLYEMSKRISIRRAA